MPGGRSGLPARDHAPAPGTARVAQRTGAPGTGAPGTGAPVRGTRRIGTLAAGLSTPGRLRRMLAWLILATLAWGSLAAFTAFQHTSGAGTVVSASEPLTHDALQIWQSLSDANDAAGAAVLAGALPPQTVLARYTSDINQAKRDIADAAARGAPMSEIQALQVGLTSYTDEVSRAEANDLLGFPVGAGYFRQASTQMTGQLLPAAHDLYTLEDDRLASASAQATGLPLVVVTILAGLALGYAYYRCARWLTRRTHRLLNGGLAVAGAVAALALLWLVSAYFIGRSDLLAAQSQGSTPVIALANADIAAAKAHTDEALTLIDNSGDDSYQGDFKTLQGNLGPGPGTLLAKAQSATAGSPAAGDASAAARQAQAWFTAHQAVRVADDQGQHQDAVAMVLSGAAKQAYGNLSADLGQAITADDAAFASDASSGQGAFSGLGPGIIAATLVMVAALVWGLSRRLAEYR
ncbi:MAG TPA: hypothetical protein VMG38_02005 [Trebonia sp.]|nr:hypothetical protein [Trebonia sp.]